jgi:hypothetical protein
MMRGHWILQRLASAPLEDGGDLQPAEREKQHTTISDVGEEDGQFINRGDKVRVRLLLQQLAVMCAGQHAYIQAHPRVVTSL